MSIEAAAGEVINRFNLPYEEDTLKKEYISINAQEIFDNAVDAMKAAWGPINSAEKE